jgi:photosystem II stability/assembly factor-like uncharacterized protein
MITLKVDLLSRRGRRGLGLIVLAVIVIVVASLVYLHPNPSPKAKPTSPTSSLLPVSRLVDEVSYDFVTPSMGWALVATTTGILANPNCCVAGRPEPFSLFRTVDGARHWLTQLAGSRDVPVGVAPHSVVKFFDKSNGFVVVSGVSDLVYRTTDGGAHWHSVVLPGPPGAVISFSDPSNGWLLVSASVTDQAVNLYGTRDGGGTWERLPDPPPDVCIPVPVSCAPLAFGGDPFGQRPALDGLGPAMARRAAITFRGWSEGWIGGRADPVPHVYSSSDGGRSWNRHDLPIPKYGLASGAIASIHLLPGAGVVASLDEGNGPNYPLTSFDGGASWSVVARPPYYGAAFTGFISFQDAFNWWDTDGSTLFKSSDAGRTWSLSNQVLAGLFFCQFLDSKHAWGLFIGIAAAPGQGLALTADGGLHWTQASVPDPA